MKVNLCCGDDYREGYLNVDFSETRSDGESIKVDLVHDVLKGLPWKDDSVEEVVFRESLEHFNRLQGFEILKEIYRVLKPDGKLDLTVPNAARQLEKLFYMVNQPVTIEQFLHPHNAPWGYPKFHEDLMGATHLESKGDSHLTLYIPQLLEVILVHVGFVLLTAEIGSSLYVTAKK